MSCQTNRHRLSRFDTVLSKRLPSNEQTVNDANKDEKRLGWKGLERVGKRLESKTSIPSRKWYWVSIGKRGEAPSAISKRTPEILDGNVGKRWLRLGSQTTSNSNVNSNVTTNLTRFE